MPVNESKLISISTPSLLENAIYSCVQGNPPTNAVPTSPPALLLAQDPVTAPVPPLSATFSTSLLRFHLCTAQKCAPGPAVLWEKAKVSLDLPSSLATTLSFQPLHLKNLPTGSLCRFLQLIPTRVLTSSPLKMIQQWLQIAS